MYACLGVTCHLHFWQNDRGLLCATAVTRVVERAPNKSQHTKLTLEKKCFPPPPPGFELSTFRSLVRHSTDKLSWIPSELGAVACINLPSARWLIKHILAVAVSSTQLWPSRWCKRICLTLVTCSVHAVCPSQDPCHIRICFYFSNTAQPTTVSDARHGRRRRADGEAVGLPPRPEEGRSYLPVELASE